MTTKTSPKYEVIDGNIVMTFPISPRISKSEKSMLLASTGGAEVFNHEGMNFQMNINVYVPIAEWTAAQAAAAKASKK